MTADELQPRTSNEGIGVSSSLIGKVQSICGVTSNDETAPQPYLIEIPIFMTSKEERIPNEHMCCLVMIATL